MKNYMELEKELLSLGLLEKAQEIYAELGGRAVVSYIRSSYRLLSKIYHPDLNPEHIDKAKIAQQRLNNINRIIVQMTDEQLIELINNSIKNQLLKKRKRILVVEDECSLQEVFRDILQLEGYEVMVAADGLDGFRRYCEFHPDLILTDVIMPKMNGLELIQRIRQQTPHIKVIYVSGFIGFNGVKRQLNEEILRYGYGALSKPFKISSMLDLVKDYLHNAPKKYSTLNVYA